MLMNNRFVLSCLTMSVNKVDRDISLFVQCCRTKLGRDTAVAIY